MLYPTFAAYFATTSVWVTWHLWTAESLSISCDSGWCGLIVGSEGDRVEVRLQNTWFVCCCLCFRSCTFYLMHTCRWQFFCLYASPCSDDKIAALKTKVSFYCRCLALTVEECHAGIKKIMMQWMQMKNSCMLRNKAIYTQLYASFIGSQLGWDLLCALWKLVIHF